MHYAEASTESFQIRPSFWCLKSKYAPAGPGVTARICIKLRNVRVRAALVGGQHLQAG